MKKEFLRRVQAEDMWLRYALLESEREIPGCGRRRVYGILVERESTGITGTVEDISTDREAVVALLHRLADCTVSPRHVADVVVDSIGVA